MQLYQFERIYSQMEKEFGKIRKGEEEVYSMLFCHWREMLKSYYELPVMCLLRIKDFIDT